MESKKILSAGCSFIYGAELSDSPDIMGLTPPSVKTWPALYAKSKGLEYHTCAVCGLSNQGIVRYVIDVVENFKVDYNPLLFLLQFFPRYSFLIFSVLVQDLLVNYRPNLSLF